MPVSRTKKIRFVNEAGPYAMLKAVEAMFFAHGPDWLTDEQLDQITAYHLEQWWSQRRRHRENRAKEARRMAS